VLTPVLTTSNQYNNPENKTKKITGSRAALFAISGIRAGDSLLKKSEQQLLQ
jgi:hypothetical protein